MPIDPNNLDEKAVQSYRGGDESITFRSGADMKAINEIEDAANVGCNPSKAYAFLRNFNLNVRSQHFPEYENQ